LNFGKYSDVLREGVVLWVRGAVKFGTYETTSRRNVLLYLHGPRPEDGRFTFFLNAGNHLQIFYIPRYTNIHSYHRDNTELYGTVYLGSIKTKFIIHGKICFLIRPWKKTQCQFFSLNYNIKYIQSVSGEIVNILGGGSMDYSV
jgi:hypothetical protein